QGGVGAALALGLLYALYRATLWQLGTSAPTIFSEPEMGQFLEAGYQMIMVGVAALLGGVGSLVAVRRFLKV
ncbi:MAG: hypothetical protein V3R61_04375, partial [candidate division NC10 bacterium]